MRGKNTNNGWMLAAVALAGALAVVAPAIAQQSASSQSATAQTESTNIDLRMLQRTGPGGDLEGTFQATTQHVTGTGSCPQETCYECLSLDSYNPTNTYNPSVPGSEIVNTVQTTNALTLGQPYMITITGTVSYWAANTWTDPDGSPAPHPIFYSPTVPSAMQGDVGSDWEYQFAYPNMSHGELFPSGPKHIVYDGISLDNGATFIDLVPLGGQLYSSSHSYSYLVEGQGVQAKFNVSDSGPHSDNYGVFKICIYKLQPVTTCGTRGGGED